MRHPLLLAALLAPALACETPGPVSPPAGGPSAAVVGMFTEPAFYNGRVVHFLLPSAGSASDNVQVVADCFRVGPEVPAGVTTGGIAYIMLIPGASQETVCSTTGEPAGALSHNHVLTTAPGDPGFNGAYQLVGVGPGPHYPGPAAADSYNSAAAVQAGLADGELVIVIPAIARTRWAVLLN